MTFSAHFLPYFCDLSPFFHPFSPGKRQKAPDFYRQPNKLRENGPFLICFSRKMKPKNKIISQKAGGICWPKAADFHFIQKNT